MSLRRFRIKDRVNARDNKGSGLRGEIIFGRNKKIIPFIDPFGKPSYRTEFEEVLYRDENIVPIGGYQFVFDKLFNIGLDQETTLRVGDLNDEAPMLKIGVPRQEYSSIYYNSEVSLDNPSLTVNTGINISALNFVFGFMIGDGGAKEDNITAIAPNYKDRVLFRPIPFRMSNDGTDIIEGKYFGKSNIFTGTNNIESVTSSYVKKFDDPAPRIVHVWVSDTDREFSVVDDSVFSSTSSIPIETYAEINMSVNKDDGRGFFTFKNSSPRINEFGLVSGWFNHVKNDYESIRLFTHFTRPSLSLADGDSIEAIYRLYAR